MSSDEPTVQLLDLPHDVLSEILNRTPVHGLLRLLSTCRAFRECITQDTRVLDMARGNQRVGVGQQLVTARRFPRLQRLVLRDALGELRPAMWTELLGTAEFMATLVSLELLHCRSTPPPPPADLGKVLGAAAHLTQLHIPGVALENHGLVCLLRACPRLQSLALAACTLSDYGLANFAGADCSASLESLALEFSSVQSTYDWLGALVNLERLSLAGTLHESSLDLSGMSRLREVDVSSPRVAKLEEILWPTSLTSVHMSHMMYPIDLAAFMPNIRRIDMQTCTSLRLTTPPDKLEHLNLSRNSFMFSDLVAYLQQSLKTLTHLVLRDCAGKAEELATLIPLLPALRVLDTDKLNDDCVCDAAANFAASLTELYASSATLTDRGVAALNAARVERLRALDLSHCRVSSVVVAPLLVANPLLAAVRLRWCRDVRDDVMAPLLLLRDLDEVALKGTGVAPAQWAKFSTSTRVLRS